MIKEIKAYPLLKGFRGSEPADIASLEETILKVASLVEQKPQIKELDLNPVFAYKDGALAVDARVVMGQLGKLKPTERLREFDSPSPLKWKVNWPGRQARFESGATLRD